MGKADRKVRVLPPFLCSVARTMRSKRGSVQVRITAALRQRHKTGGRGERQLKFVMQ